MFSGGGGEEEEEASDVAAKKRAKVMAKNQAKRNQEQAWENARVEKQREQAMQSHRQGEKDAVAIADEYETRMQEQAMLAHRAGEWNAVAIAEDYKSRVREEANSSHREGERNAMDAVREYATQSYREGERVMTQTIQQAKEKTEQPWWAWDSMKENLNNTITSRGDWANRIVGALPKVKDAILLAPIKIKETLSGNYLFQVNQKIIDTVATINNAIVSRLPNWVTNITGLNTTPIPKSKNGYKNWITEQFGFNVQRKSGTTIKEGEVINRIKDYFSREWTDRVGGFKNGIAHIQERITSLFTRQTAKETAEEVAEAAVEAAARQATESTAKSSLKAWLPSAGDALVETGFNIYDYTLGSKKDEPDKGQKILVDSGVDISGAALTGAAAAGTVALIVAAVVYFVGSPVTVPLTGLVIMTVVISFFFDIVLETTGVKRVVKDGINNYIDHLQSFPSQPAAKMPYEYESPTQFSPSIQVSPPVTPAQTPPPSPSQTPEP